jgi:hypothetical protein
MYSVSMCPSNCVVPIIVLNGSCQMVSPTGISRYFELYVEVDGYFSKPLRCQGAICGLIQDESKIESNVIRYITLLTICK